MDRHRTRTRLRLATPLCIALLTPAGAALAAPSAASLPRDLDVKADAMLAAEEAKLYLEEGIEANAIAGRSVAISGDTALIGAPDDDVAGVTDAGAVYVFVRSGGVWTQQARLLADEPQESDHFGAAVALDGDTAVVGAPGDRICPSCGSVRGAVYTWRRSGSEWTREARLTAGAAEELGAAVAVSGDTVVAGAPGGFGSGEAFVFFRSGATWTFEQELISDDSQSGDDYGTAVAIDGDTALVGSPGTETDVGSGAGAVFVFSRSGGTWTQQEQLLATGGTAIDGLGTAVALDGDTALAGAPGDRCTFCIPGSGPGAAYVFTRSGATWTQQAQLLASDGEVNDHYGAAVALSGDLALIGNSVDDTAAGTNAGSVYVLSRSGTAWSEDDQLLPGASGDRFGRSVALDGPHAVIGASSDDTDLGANSGSAHAYLLDGGTFTREMGLLPSGARLDDRFGVATSLSGDRLLVGAPWYDTDAGLDAGAAYVYRRTEAGWQLEAQLLPDEDSNGSFGAAVALDGDTALVGASGASGGGAAYLYRRNGSRWEQATRLAPVAASPAGQFGFSVALDDGTALVGAPLETVSGGVKGGAVHVFVDDGTTWVHDDRLAASDAAENDGFGYFVAINGDAALVSALIDDTAAGVDAGSAYVFRRTGAGWVEEAHLFADDGAGGDVFGFVALDGDTAVVGSPGDDTPAGADAGSVHVFVRTAAGWALQDQLFAEEAAANDHFGYSVALDGDLLLSGSDADDTAAGANAGSVAVFRRAGGLWTQRTQLFASDGGVDDLFGSAVALDGTIAAVGALAGDAAEGAAEVADAGAVYLFRLAVPGLRLDGGPLVTSEAGPATSFTVVLDAPPASDVVLDLAVDDATEATISPAQLTFTTADWNVPQLVTVTGVDDALPDGDRPFAVSVAVAAGLTADPDYAELPAETILGVNTDDEAPSPTPDLVPPRVLAVTTSGGVDLAPCATQRSAIGALRVTFDDAMPTATDPAHYRVVAAGPDGDLSTAACEPAAGDDEALAIVSVLSNGHPDTPTLLLSLAAALPAGPVRVTVCPAIEDDGGNSLDGDGDGEAGDAFVRTFRADPGNLFANGHFDRCPTTLAPWQSEATPPDAVLPIETEDATASTLSGAVRLLSAAATPAGIAQCADYPTTEQLYRLHLAARVDPFGVATATLTASCEHFPAAGCSGTPLALDEAAIPLVAPPLTWQDATLELDPPAGALSVLCALAVTPDDSGEVDFDAYLDRLTLVGSEIPLFADGFESGDLTAWSQASP